MLYDENEITQAIEDIREMRNVLESGRPKLRRIFLSPSFGRLCIVQAMFFCIALALYSLFKDKSHAGTILAVAIILDCLFCGKRKLDIFSAKAGRNGEKIGYQQFLRMPFIKELIDAGYILAGCTAAISLLVSWKSGQPWLAYPLLFSGTGAMLLHYGMTLKSYSYRFSGILAMLTAVASALFYTGSMELWIAVGLGLLLLFLGLSILWEGKS